MLVLFSVLSLAAAQADSPGAIGAALGPTLDEVRKFAAAGGEAVWPGYGSAPFEFLLLESAGETLLCRAAIPDGFTADGSDESLGCPRYRRPRTQLSDKLLAAMPLFGPPPTIVMGTPETTGRSKASWLRTILHEHFHQWQFSVPNYFARVDSLDLKGGDETGMWTLNFAFPYQRADVIAAQSAASHALADAVAARGTGDFYPKFDAYLAKRSAFERAAGARNWRYIEFQLWQEGVARWTEIRLGKSYPDPEVAKSAATLEQRTLDALRSPDLAGQQREFVYAYGAAEAMLMDVCGPRWRDDYASALALGALLNAARATCGLKG